MRDRENLRRERIKRETEAALHDSGLRFSNVNSRAAAPLRNRQNRQNQGNNRAVCAQTVFRSHVSQLLGT